MRCGGVQSVAATMECHVANQRLQALVTVESRGVGHEHPSAGSSARVAHRFRRQGLPSCPYSGASAIPVHAKDL